MAIVGSVFVEAEDSFGQLSLKGLQFGQQPIVKDPRLGPVEAWQDAVFNYLHGGERNTPLPLGHAHADNAPLLRTCNASACYGVVQCLPVKSPTIYRRNLRREKNDRLVSVHISIDYGDVW